jgi:glycosyltransferase involved in cell wall biosynthesis
MPNGTDTAFPADPQGLKARAAERFRIPQGKRVLLFVGQQIWYKNQRLILDAFRLLCDREDDWLLIMVGTGKDEQEIERYAASMNLSGHVIFTGQIKDRELLQGVYLNSDLLFFPSVFDNAPLVLREAAVLGVPTLAVEGSNAAGAIRKNENGFTAAATPEDMSGEIRRIFTETDIRAVGKKARETIPVSWEKLIPMVLDRYRTVIEKYKRDR